MSTRIFWRCQSSLGTLLSDQQELWFIYIKKSPSKWESMDLTESDLFENLVEIMTDIYHFDLHNNYSCVKVSYSGDALVLEFQNDQGLASLILEFKEVRILTMQIPLRTLIIDNFHRGRYELDGKLYDEPEGRKCFYLEFYEEGSIELLCRQALVIAKKSCSLLCW